MHSDDGSKWRKVRARAHPNLNPPTPKPEPSPEQVCLYRRVEQELFGRILVGAMLVGGVSYIGHAAAELLGSGVGVGVGLGLGVRVGVGVGVGLG